MKKLFKLLSLILLTIPTIVGAVPVSLEKVGTFEYLRYNGDTFGIGTTTPGYKLTVGGDVNFTGSLYQNGTLFTSGGSLSTSTIRTMFTNSATGLTYTNSTGDTALTSGYVIPLTASTTQWATAFASTTALTPTYIRSLFSNTATGLTYSAGVISLTAGYVVPLSASTTEWSTAYASTTALTPTYIRSLFSNTATGLTYSAGVTSLTAGYIIPLSASTTEWSGFYTTPSTRITAGANCSWALNVFNCAGGSGSSTVTLLVGNGLLYTATSSDSLAIGTSTAKAKLDIYDNNTAGCSPSIHLGGNPGGDSDGFFCRLNDNDSLNDDSLSFGNGTSTASSSLLNINLATGMIGIGTSTQISMLQVVSPNVGSTGVATSGITLQNPTPATVGVQKYSPSITWLGQGWKTTATAGSQEVGFQAYLVPVQGTTNPSSTWTLASNVNGGAYTARLTVTDGGVVNMPGSLTVNGTAVITGNLSSAADIFTTGTGDDLFLGNSTQASALFRAFADGGLIAASSTSIGSSTMALGARLQVVGQNGSTTNLLKIASSTGTSFFDIDYTGNVGIGTSSPDKLLTVTGDQALSIMKVERVNAATNANLGTINLKGRSTGTIGSGFGVGMLFSIQGSGTAENIIGSIQAIRNTADNSGVLRLSSYGAGALTFPGLIVDGLNYTVSIGTLQSSSTLAIIGTSTKPITDLFSVASSSSDTVFIIKPTGFVGVGTITPNSTLHVEGSFGTKYRATTTTGTLLATDQVVDVTSETFALTLPTAVGITGRQYTIKNSGTGVVTINTTSSQTIDGNASGVLTLNQYDSLTVVSTNVGWIII